MIRLLLLVCSLVFFQACSGQEKTSVQPAPVQPAPVQQDKIDTSYVSSAKAGATPFISFLDIAGTNALVTTDISYRIATRPGYQSKPVNVNYSMAYLSREGYVLDGGSTIRIPVFGLYANSSNEVSITLNFSDGTSRTLTTSITTAAFNGASAIYMKPKIRVSRGPLDGLGFNYFTVKNAFDAPVVIDTDGELRWARDFSLGSSSGIVFENTFVQGAKNVITQYHFDGRIKTSNLAEPRYYQFHHNIDMGPTGMLGEFDQLVDGQKQNEFIVSEFDLSGKILKEWDFATIVSEHMRANGDNPDLFVDRSVDWFHVNASTYDPRDRSIIASSRENFLIKVDYDTGRIIWILGDTSKYWYTFPSLRAKALTLTDGLAPMGQHSVSITPDGYVQVFNNGLRSFNQPPSAPAGADSTYSTVSTYMIDQASMKAKEIRSFDYNKSVYSDICSSAYTESDGSLLVNYSATDNRLTARLVGVSPIGQVAFDFEYPSPFPCQTSFNATVIQFESMSFK